MKQPNIPTCDTGLERKISVISLQCRICYENDKNEPLLTPCNCKGTVGVVHQSCLEKWFAESNMTNCELCHVVFNTERLPKRIPRQSIWHWVRSHTAPTGITRGVRSDIIACTVITPVAIIITYACLYSSDYYKGNKFYLQPGAQWTSLLLLIMIGMMLIGYYLWVYSVIRMYSRMWYNWWQRDCVVRYVPPNNPPVCCHTAIEVANTDNTIVSTTSLLDKPSTEFNESEDVSATQISEKCIVETNSKESETVEDEVVKIDIPKEEFTFNEKRSQEII